MSKFSENVKAAYEGKDLAFYNSVKTEIIRYKASGARLDAFLDESIFAAMNVIKNSVSLNRLNILLTAFQDCGENTRLAKIAKFFTHYAGLVNCLAYDSKVKIFTISDYASFKAIAQNMVLPSVKFTQFCKEFKPEKVAAPLTEQQAINKVRQVYLALKDNNFQSGNFQAIFTAMETFIDAFDETYKAQNEKNKIRDLLKK